jgi:4a-hydroxytetrahydrobiopterin dehydratase
MAVQALTELQIKAGLSGLPDWDFVEGQITKTFSFDSYAAGIMFASAVGWLSDRMDHHPDLHVGYRKVRVSLNTHDVGGVSELDFELARRIELL